MRFRTCLVRLLLISAAAAQETPPASPLPGASGDTGALIRGTVVSTSGAPIRRANLRLIPQKDASGTVAPLPLHNTGANYRVESDERGNFGFEDIAPGRYALVAERAGYVTRVYGSPRLDSAVAQLVFVAPGATITDIKVVMAQQSLISGRVTDEFGEPVGQVNVQALRRKYVGGGWSFVPVAYAQANADGSFVIGNLLPGRYYVLAIPYRATPSENDLPGSRQRAVHPRATFYGDTTVASLALPVEVGAGLEFRSASIVMARSPGYEVAGRVTGFPSSAQGLSVQLRPADTAQLVTGEQQSALLRGSQDSFVFRGVVPGTYQIFAASANAESRDHRWIGHTTLDVPNADVRGLEVAPDPETTISGSFFVEGSVTAPVSAEIALESETLGQTVTLRFSPEGTLPPVQVPSGTFRVRMFLRSEVPHYLKSLSVDGQPLTNNELVLPENSQLTLNAVLSPNASSVEGDVHKSDGTTVPLATVVAWPVSSVNSGFLNIAPPQPAVSAERGEFEIRNLAPGDYYIAAFEDPDPGLIQSPDFLAQFEGQAAKVMVAENVRANAAPTLIEAAEISAAELRLP